MFSLSSFLRASLFLSLGGVASAEVGDEIGRKTGTRDADDVGAKRANRALASEPSSDPRDTGWSLKIEKYSRS